MNCPYLKEDYLGICVAPDAIHASSIEDMRDSASEHGTVSVRILRFPGIQRTAAEPVLHMHLKADPEHLSVPPIALEEITRDLQQQGCHRKSS